MYIQEANGDTLDNVFSMAAGVINAKTGMARPEQKVNSYSSIAKMASKLIAIFPVLCSRTVSAETAQRVTKYIEQMSCHFLILGLQQANIDSARSGIEYLKKFHQNLGDTNDLDTTISSIGSWISAYETGKGFAESSLSASLRTTDIDLDSILESDNDLVISSRDLRDLMNVMRENENIIVYDTELNPVSINDYFISESYNGDYHVRVRSLNEANNNNNILRDSWLRKKGWERYIGLDSTTKTYKDLLRQQQQEDIDEELQRQQEEREENKRRQTAADREHLEDRQEKKRLAHRDEIEHNIDRFEKQRKDAKAEREHDEDRARDAQKRADEELSRRLSGANVGILKDQDIKKMNDAVPSLLDVRFYNGSNATVETHFLIGVKAKLLPVTTSEILRRIVNNNKDGHKFGKFMRVLTGELKASEAILGISRIKDDLTSSKKKGAYGDTWNLLQNRARAAKMQVKRGQQNDFSAITTVVISQSDADELYREENLDINNPKAAKRFMEAYNIMAFAIADDATESLKILFDDGNKFYTELSYKTLERETENGEYKKLINLMAASK